MSFVILQDEDGKDFISNVSNIASIEAGEKSVILHVNHGPSVKTDRSLNSHMQKQFTLSAGKQTPQDAAMALAEEIAYRERNGDLLDLRKLAPPVRKKEPFDPGAGW